MAVMIPKPPGNRTSLQQLASYYSHSLRTINGSKVQLEQIGFRFGVQEQVKDINTLLNRLAYRLEIEYEIAKKAILQSRVDVKSKV